MFKTLSEDRPFIEEKYHKKTDEFNPFNRMGYHGWECKNSFGMSDDEIREGLLNLSQNTKSQFHSLAKAEQFKFLLDNSKFDINDHDYFIYFYSWSRLIENTAWHLWQREIFDGVLSDVNQELSILNDSGAVTAGPDFDHVVPDWNAFLSLGFAGILERVKEYKEKYISKNPNDCKAVAFYDSMIIEYSAVIDFLDRIYKYSLTKNNEKSQKVSNCLLHLRDGAPTDTYEALQAIYIYFIFCECVDGFQTRSLGNGLDSSLLKFYKNDIESNHASRDEIGEYIGYFLMQFSAIGNYWGHPLYIGGTDLNGETKYNDLSILILEVYDELGIYNPKIQAKVNYNTPKDVLFRIFDMVRRGNNSVVFCCEPGMVKAIMAYGATYEEAYDFDIRGCYETGVRGNEVSTVAGYINALKALRYVFTQGIDENTKMQVGAKTKPLNEITSFSDFYSEFLKQWSSLIERVIRCSDSYDSYFDEINPSPFYSATILHSLETGVDGYAKGVKFNNSALLNCGFASCVDSLMAVKEFVFDKKSVTLERFKEILDSDWQKDKMLRAKVLHSHHKYGNGDAETDKYASALSRWYCGRINNRPNKRGGVYKAILHSAKTFIDQGLLTGATPDGRKNKDEESKNASPSVGMDKNGVTALIESALSLVPYLYSESFCIDIMLHPTSVSGEEGLEIMKALLFTYMEKGGMSMQFNIFDSYKLRDAQEHPEKYQNLQVRVCGWNVLWNNLSRREQESYIKRCENIAE